MVHFEVNYELYKLRTVAQSTEERYMDRQRKEDSDALHLTFWLVCFAFYFLTRESVLPFGFVCHESIGFSASRIPRHVEVERIIDSCFAYSFLGSDEFKECLLVLE
jgi:hypothetical protein